MAKKVLKVNGMSCDHCVRTVSSVLDGLGLTDIKVDLKGGTASFNYDPAQTPLETIKEAVAEAGYDMV